MLPHRLQWCFHRKMLKGSWHPPQVRTQSSGIHLLANCGRIPSSSRTLVVIFSSSDTNSLIEEENYRLTGLLEFFWMLDDLWTGLLQVGSELRCECFTVLRGIEGAFCELVGYSWDELQALLCENLDSFSKCWNFRFFLS